LKTSVVFILVILVCECQKSHHRDSCNVQLL
jgi:hypothetical protein